MTEVPHHRETFPFICFVNQWSGSYLIGASVIKECLRAFIDANKTIFFGRWEPDFNSHFPLTAFNNIFWYTLFYKQHFHKQRQTGIGKKLSNTLTLFENYSFSSSTLSSKNIRRYSKKSTKSKCVCFDDVIWIITMKITLKMNNKSQSYNLVRPRPRHWHKYIKYKMCPSIMMVIWNKQHLSNIWSSNDQKVKQHWGWVQKKRCL